MTIPEIIGKLKSLDCIYCIECGLTHMPYVVCNPTTYDDEITLYAEEPAAIAAAEIIDRKGYKTTARKISQKDIVDTLSSYLATGVNLLRIYLPEETITVSLDELIKRKLPENLTPEQIPVENPTLMISMLYCMQEARKAEKTQEEMKKLNELDEEMSRNIALGKFYLSFTNVTTPEGTTEQLLCIPNKEGMVIPIFTDQYEIQKYLMNISKANPAYDTVTGKVIEFKNLASMQIGAALKGFVINPAGIALGFPQAHVTRLIQAFCPTDAS